MTQMQQLAAVSAVVFLVGIACLVRFVIEYRDPERREASWTFMALGVLCVILSAIWAIAPVVHAWDLYVA